MSKITIIVPKGATSKIEKDLVKIVKKIYKKLKLDKPFSGLADGYEYGIDYENDVFEIHSYCWCEKDECPLCNFKKPLFTHKKGGFGIDWYKWIGRDTRYTREISLDEWNEIYKECMASIQ